MNQPTTVEEEVFVNPWDQRDNLGLSQALTATVKVILSQPKLFFSSLNVSPGSSFSPPFLFYFLITILTTATAQFLISVVGYSLDIYIHHKSTTIMSVAVKLAIALLTTTASTVLIFLIAGITHLFVLLFGGKGGYKGTFYVSAYSAAPVVLSVVPIVGPLVGGIWMTVLGIIGFKHVHQMSTPRAVLAYLFIPLLIFIAAIALAIAAPNVLKSMAPSTKGHKVKTSFSMPEFLKTAPAQLTPARVPSGTNRVEGIMDQANPVVMIDGRPYGLNETIGQGKIVAIGSGLVTVQFGDQQKQFRVGEAIGP